MSVYSQSRYRKLLVPLLSLIAVIGFCGYGLVALLSADPLWFLGRASLPDPQRIVVRVDGQETILEPGEAGYDLIVDGARQAMSAFDNSSPRSAGLSQATLADYQRQGTILELYFNRPVDFYLPFDDQGPTALLFPIEGKYGGRGYVFMGKNGRWWAGQMVMSDPQPILDALYSLGYLS